MSMEGVSTDCRRASGSGTAEMLRRWVGAGLLTLAASICLLALLLLIRRALGGIERPVPGVGLWLLGMVLAAAVGAMSWLRGVRSRRAALSALSATVGGSCLVALALSLPRSSPPGLLALWILPPAVAGIVWAGLRRRDARSGEGWTTPVGSPTGDGDPESREDGSEIEPETITLDDDVVQQMTRSVDGRGAETVFGVFRIRFAAGQRGQNLHLSFCPPLGEVPHIDVRQVSGPDVTTKVAEAHTFGARLETRRVSASGDTADALLEVHVQSSAPTPP